MMTPNLVLLGAGRIGEVHGTNIARHPRARVHSVVDVDRGRAEALAAKLSSRAVPDAETAVADPAADAVLICTSTDTHVEMIELAASSRKPVFCEKPIDLDLARVDRCLERVGAAGVPLFIGFNRRFDPHFGALKDALLRGELGRIELLKITSRDPQPPPPAYVKVSGGIFRDMMIHDLDMARFLLAEEPVEVHSVGSCLVDPEIGRAGDVDTAVVVMRTAAGTLCVIDNSRRAVYGYDQRIEAFGEKGMIAAGNPAPTTLTRATAGGVLSDKPPWFFLERYAEAYRAELDHFLDVLDGRASPLIDGRDGRAALVLADAAARSLAEGRPVKVGA
jgi:myo-inositol 2-dehydrogenase/D-chiro-inositol 1-dehydrogenase